MENQPRETTYAFTQTQLFKMLSGALGLFIEYRDKHEKDEEQAGACAISEVLDGLRADRELATEGEDSLRLRVPVDAPAQDGHAMRVEIESSKHLWGRRQSFYLSPMDPTTADRGRLCSVDQDYAHEKDGYNPAGIELDPSATWTINYLPAIREAINKAGEVMKEWNRDCPL